MEPIELFGAGTFGKSAVVTAQRRLNVYVEPRTDGDKKRYAIFGTPGLASYITLSPTPAGPIRGMYATQNYLHVVAGRNYYKYDKTLTLNISDTSGTILTDTNPVCMVSNGTQLMIVDGNSGYIVTNADSSGGTLSAIADADFNNGCFTCAFLAGFFAVEKPDTGEVYISASYDGTSWNATDFATAEQNPDDLVAVGTLSGHLVLFGTETIEWWAVTGALDFPFAPIVSATQQYGLAARFSRAQLDNTIFFLARPKEGPVQVMRFNGYRAERVSDSDLENVINGFNTVEDAEALSYMLDGHPFYQLTFPTADRSFLFDASTGIWSETQTGVSSVPARHIGRISASFNGLSLISDRTAATIYKVSPMTYTDGGTTIKRLLQSRHIHQSGNEFHLSEVFLDMETGVGLQTGQGSDPEIMMQVSKDGGRSWGPERWVKLGKVGEYRKLRVIWRRLGSARDFVFRFAMTDPVKFVITNSGASIAGKPQ